MLKRSIIAAILVAGGCCRENDRAEYLKGSVIDSRRSHGVTVTSFDNGWVEMRFDRNVCGLSMTAGAMKEFSDALDTVTTNALRRDLECMKHPTKSSDVHPSN